jgi:chromosome segregation ATPase
MLIGLLFAIFLSAWTLVLVFQEKRAVREMIHKFKQAILFLQSENKKMLNHLNEARVEKFQSSLLADAGVKRSGELELNLQTLQQELDKLSSDLKQARSSPAEPPKEEESVEDLYKQLKKQFEEKSVVLHETRKELFHLEGKYLACQRELELQMLELNPFELSLQHYLKQIDAECKDLEYEITTLHDIIAQLLTQKRAVRPKRLAVKKQASK